jgi:hypothetical protein
MHVGILRCCKNGQLLINCSLLLWKRGSIRNDNERFLLESKKREKRELGYNGNDECF